MKNKIINLKNGGKLVYIKNKYSKSTAVEVGFSVGANKDKKAGTAHFLEHTLFKKTKNRTNEEINRDRSKIAFLNASTGLDFLVIKFSRTNKLIEKSFDFASDVLLNSVIDDEYLESEKGVICEELKMSLDNEKRDVFVYNFAQASTKSKFASSIVGGEEAIIKSINFNDLKNFKKKHFVGNNFVISVSSSLSLSKIKKFANKYFVSKIPFDKDYQKKESYFELANIDKKSSLKVYPLDQEKVSVLLSFKLNKSERDIYEKNLSIPFLARYLSGAQGNLFLRLRNKGLVYRFGCDVSCFSKTSLFNITFESSKDKIKDIINEISNEASNVVSCEIEHEIIKEYQNNLLYKEDEKMPAAPATIAHLNMLDVISTGKVFELSKAARRKLISKVTPKSVKLAANEIFDKNSEVFVTLLGNVEKKDIHALQTIKNNILIGEYNG